MTVQALDHFKLFIEEGNLQEAALKVRPKKMPLDQVTKIIEELFSMRFIRETNLLKANIKHADASIIEQLQNSFIHFVIETLSEKAKSKYLYEQVEKGEKLNNFLEYHLIIIQFVHL